MRLLDETTGSLVREIESDARIGQGHQEAMRKIAEADPKAEILGMDNRFRPVIRAQLGGATRRTQFSLLANGQAKPVSKPIAERWS